MLKDKYWSTHGEQTMENFETSDIVLVYRGNLKFMDTAKYEITVDNIEVPAHLASNVNMSFFTT